LHTEDHITSDAPICSGWREHQQRLYRGVKGSSGKPLNDVVSRSEVEPLAETLGHVHDDVAEGSEGDTEHTSELRAVTNRVLLGTLFVRLGLSDGYVGQIQEVLVEDLRKIGESAEGSRDKQAGMSEVRHEN
jgi:hypothetical protein